MKDRAGNDETNMGFIRMLFRYFCKKQPYMVLFMGGNVPNEYLQALLPFADKLRIQIANELFRGQIERNLRHLQHLMQLEEVIVALVDPPSLVGKWTSVYSNDELL